MSVINIMKKKTEEEEEERKKKKEKQVSGNIWGQEFIVV
jgi:hypothetical protein